MPERLAWTASSRSRLTAREPRGATLGSVGMALPETVVDNAPIAERLGLDDRWIVERTGIRPSPHARGSHPTRGGGGGVGAIHASPGLPRRTERHEGTWWEDWTRWLEQRSGEQVDPPPVGSDLYPALEDAPGTYVRETPSG